MESLRRVWETLKNLKHKGPQTLFCPKCRGNRIFPSSSLGGVIPSIYKCEDCDYQGYVIIEMDHKEVL